MTFEIRDGEPYVCDRHVAWRRSVMHEDLPAGLYRFRGFHVPIENGLILSSQWGSGNYCANYELLGSPPWEQREFLEACPSAELACWWDAGDGSRGDDSMLEWPTGDVVIGHWMAECWWDLLDVLSRVPTGGTIRGIEWIKEAVT